MRILMIGGLVPWHPQAGGGQLVAYKLAEALARAGHKVSYLSTVSKEYHRDQNLHGLTYIFETADRWWDSSWLRSLTADHLRGYDIVHIHASPQTLGYYVGCALRRRMRRDIRLALTIHAPKVHSFPRSFAEACLMPSCRGVDTILAVSEFSRRDISRCYKISPTRIKAVYNGADAALFLGQRSVRRSAEDPVTLLFCGRLNGTRQKGIEILLEAMPLVLQQHDVVLNVIGVGPRLREYRRDAKRLNIESQITFLGFVEYGKLPQYYADADMLVLPSRRESFGLVLAEAMACGLPVVSTTVGAIPEVVQDGITGVLVPPDDARALANAINSLLSDPRRMVAMGVRGRERVKKYFTWDKVAQRVVRAYEVIL